MFAVPTSKASGENKTAITASPRHSGVSALTTSSECVSGASSKANAVVPKISVSATSSGHATSALFSDWGHQPPSATEKT